MLVWFPNRELLFENNDPVGLSPNNELVGFPPNNEPLLKLPNNPPLGGSLVFPNKLPEVVVFPNKLPPYLGAVEDEIKFPKSDFGF